MKSLILIVSILFTNICFATDFHRNGEPGGAVIDRLGGAEFDTQNLTWPALPPCRAIKMYAEAVGCPMESNDYVGSLSFLNFNFCGTPCTTGLPSCGTGGSQIFYSSIASGTNAVRIQIFVDLTSTSVYSGCDTNPGDSGEISVWAGNQNFSTLVKVWWYDPDEQKYGNTIYTISPTGARKLDSITWWSDAPSSIETFHSSHVSGRLLEVTLNSSDDVTQNGKRFGISSTSNRAYIMQVDVDRIATINGEQTPNGIFLQSGSVHVRAKLYYRDNSTINGPVITWKNSNGF